MSDFDPNRMQVFTFGDPVPVMAGRDILDYIESWWSGHWYEPPVSFTGLAKSFRANPHHSSAIYLKRDMLARDFIPHPLLSKQAFSRWVLDYLVFGNAPIELIYGKRGAPLELRPSPAKYTRRGREPDQFWFVPGVGERHEFKRGAVFMLMEPDINQEVYGLPQYLSGLNSAWLNEAATLFRRRYYENGSHAGFILYINDPAQSEDDITAIRTALKESKGVGNFKNLFMYSPNGKKDGIQLIPVAEVAAKDEFFNIKNVTRDDLLTAHRVYPTLLAIVPSNAAGFGDAATVAAVFHQNEIAPLQERLMELNQWMGVEVVRFKTTGVAA